MVKKKKVRARRLREGFATRCLSAFIVALPQSGQGFLALRRQPSRHNTFTRSTNRGGGEGG